MKKRKFLMWMLLITLFINVSSYSYAEDMNHKEVIVEDGSLEKYDTYSKEITSLSTDLDKACEKLNEGLENLDDEIDISMYNVSTSDIEDIYNGLISDNPMLFYTSGFSYHIQDDKVINIVPKYNDDKIKIKQNINELDLKINNILDSIIKPSMSDFEKEVAIHDYIVLNTEYDQKNYDNNTIPKESYNVYGVLIKGIGVCQGYAESMKLLLNKVGIESIVVSSPGMMHAWNIVTLDGEDYHVDATWNDPVPNIEGYVRYKYLNVSDEKMKESHNWDYNKYPKCNSSYYSFLWEISAPKYKGDHLYYASNEKSKEYIYKLNLKTLKKEQITNVRAPYFDIAGEWIYFSNYSDGGHLFKINLDGRGLKKLNNTNSKEIYLRDGYIYYMEMETGIEKRIKVEVNKEPEQPEKPQKDEVVDEGYLERFKNWLKKLFIKANQSWELNILSDRDMISIKISYPYFYVSGT